MDRLSCEYHPEREAIDKCHTCLRLICLEDKQIVKSTSYYSFKSSEEGIYCSTCYYELAKSLGGSRFSKDLAGAISFIIFVFFGGFILILNLLGVTSSFIIYFFAIFIAIAISMVWGVQFMTRSVDSPPINIARARLSHEKLIHSRTSYKSSNLSEFCMHCGASIKISSTFCGSCGEQLNPTK